jgi:hypothetical protein
VLTGAIPSRTPAVVGGGYIAALEPVEFNMQGYLDLVQVCDAARVACVLGTLWHLAVADSVKLELGERDGCSIVTRWGVPSSVHRFTHDGTNTK